MVGNESSEQLYDIYGMWHVPFWQTRAFIIALWCFAALCAIAIIYFLIRMIRARKKTLKPWEWANRELDTLWEQRGFTREDGKRFYSQLTEIIKGYLEKRYGYHVRSATDIELIAYLQAHSFDPALLHDVQQIFEGTQEIKFANLDAIPEQIERDFALCKAFISKTISDQDVA